MLRRSVPAAGRAPLRPRDTPTAMLKEGIDFEFRLPPPAPARIARRALLLTALACRGQLADYATDRDAQAIDARLRTWLGTTSIPAEGEPGERTLLEAPLGSLGALRASLLGESAAVLAWGIGLFRVPTLALAVDAADVGAALGWLDPAVDEAIDTARSRARTDIVMLAEALEVAHGSVLAIRGGTRPTSLIHFRGDRGRVAQDTDPLPIAADGALTLDGVALEQSQATQVEAFAARVRARRRAILWLAGQAVAYSAIRVEA